MKRIAPCLLCALVAVAGCLPPLVVREPEKAAATQYRSAAPTPLVTAEAVNEKNASEKAQELRAELEREAAREPGSR